MNYETRLAELKSMIEKIEYLKYTTNSLVYWDKITYMPKNAIGYRSKVMSFLAGEQYKLLADPKFQKLVEYFKNSRKNDLVTKAMIKKLVVSSENVRKIPENEYQQYIELIAVSEQIWAESKKNKDFHQFLPYLESIFQTFRQFAEYWEYQKNPYDALLESYVEGLTVDTIDAMVSEIKPVLITLLGQIEEKNRAGEAPKQIDIGSVNCEKQEAVWNMILKKIGFRFDSGRIDIGSHPTILASSPDDVRVVNTFAENDFWGGIFNILHCGGRGIYQQSISKELLRTLLAEVPSFAMEEAVGRFYENIIGRSKGFWQYIYQPLVELVPELSVYTPQEIYESVNYAHPSLIRLEADELTYLLHIIIRYELEKEIIGGTIKVCDLPEVWKRKYEESLGISPQNDEEGVLQDIHWAAGYVGYFPSYFFANITAAQLGAAINEQIGDINKLMATGQFEKIHNWLSQNIYCHGSLYSSNELIEKACGKPLASSDYIDYLREKFSEVYKLF